MKHIAKLLVVIMIVACSFMSCDKKDRINYDENGKAYPLYIYKGSKWDILQINDSIITMVPALNGSNDIKPVVININNLNNKESNDQSLNSLNIDVE